MAQLLDGAGSVVDDSLAGLVASHPSLRLLQGHRVVVRADADDVKKRGLVALVSGGGSGHEPSHACYVGRGMLTAAVAGDVFASPPPSSILAAVRAVGSRAGVLLIIKNYTGDRLNFGLALERAASEGFSVRMIVVADDMAFDCSEGTAGRRGLAGALFVHKICGAMAEAGKSLDEIYDIATYITNNVATIGVSLSPCCLPGRGPSFELPTGMMELGLGIHGEPGLRRTSLASATKTVEMMVERLFSQDAFKKDDKVALIVNNLGGLSNLELGVVSKCAIRQLVDVRNLVVSRVICGCLMTSINMAGVSLSLLKLNEPLTDWLDKSSEAPGWPYSAAMERTDASSMKIESAQRKTSTVDAPTDQGRAVYRCIKAMCTALAAEEDLLNELDREAGDGDCGLTLRHGAEAIIEALGPAESPHLPVNNAAATAAAVGNIVENVMGGTSGAIYSIMLVRISTTLEKCSAEGLPWIVTIARALSESCSAISRYGGAKRGDRTMLDSLYGALDHLQGLADGSIAAPTNKGEIQALLKTAVEGAEKAAQSTKDMKAKAGRASYVSAEHWTKPDAGATAVALWMTALLHALKS